MRGLWILCACLGMQSCLFERTAGTEVGNPEIVVASVVTMPAQSGWEMQSFNVKMMGVHYTTLSGDTGMLFRDQAGHMIDAARDSNGGMVQKMATPTIRTVRMDLAFPKAGKMLPDSMPWSQFHEPGWAVFGYYNQQGVEKKLIFAMPDSLSLTIDFSAETLRSNRAGDTLHVKVWFDCKAWMASLDTSIVYQIRQGMDGAYSLLSPSENALAYQKMRLSFDSCFLSVPK